MPKASQAARTLSFPHAARARRYAYAGPPASSGIRALTGRTHTGRNLSALWGVKVAHPLYHKDGTWYHGLKGFPAALFDPNGYVVFETEEEFRRCPAIRPSPGGNLGIAGGISSLPSYVQKVMTAAEQAARSAIETEIAAHGGSEDDTGFMADPEGRAVLRKHITYERSSRNRAECIRVHGAKCKACGFNFDVAYGRSHARSYIEVHHIRSVSEQAGKTINPKRDLVPLCSNCHSMIHREHGRILSVEELRRLLGSNARKADN